MKQYLPKSVNKLKTEVVEITRTLSEIADRLDSFSGMAIMRQRTPDGQGSVEFKAAADYLRKLELSRIVDALESPNWG